METMKRLVLLLLAATMIGGPTGAAAQDRARDQARERASQRSAHVAPSRGQYGPARGQYGPGHSQYRGAPRAGRAPVPYGAPAPYVAVPAPRDIGAGRFDYQGGYARQYAPARAWGRGQYLPQEYWGSRVQDYGEYRLRPPPYGYGWVAVGKDIYLMQDATGLVLDAVPGAY